jgi:drug/metabolite transporter (DMT)-like permease
MTASLAIGLGLAAVCAVGTNFGWLVKHRGAQEIAPMRHRRPLRSIRVLFGSRRFAWGVIIASAAGLLHIAALAFAPISVVQAVLATGVVVLAVLAGGVFGLHVPPRQWAGVTLSAAGLALLAITLPTIGGAHNRFSATEMASFDLVLALVSLLLLTGPRLRRFAFHDGVLIGAAAGIYFGISDVAIKGLIGVAHEGIASLLLSPWLLVAIVTGVAAQYVSARSLQTGDAVPVTAYTGLAVNVANIAGGIVVFGDPLASGLGGTIVEMAGFALLCAAAVLIRTPAPSSRTVRVPRLISPSST